MCFESSLLKKKRLIEEYFKANFIPSYYYEPYYHVSGFTYPELQIIKMDDPSTIHPANWGLIPSWGESNISGFRKKYNTLNAKSETLLESNMYQESAREHRCLILADGFFEPHHINNISYPYYCFIPSKKFEDGKSLFAYSGIYSELEDGTFSCSILTTEANDFFSEIHNKKKRMPLIIDESYTKEWLAQNLTGSQITELIKDSFTHKKFDAYQVSRNLYKRGINHNHPGILTKVERNTLF
jgi:putative SOS response-associated peptidase YedK